MLAAFQAGVRLLAQNADAAAPSSFDFGHLVRQVLVTIIYIVIGLVFFALSDWLVERVMPRTVRKAIEEDKNVAVAIVVAAGILGVALIVAAAIRG